MGLEQLDLPLFGEIPYGDRPRRSAQPQPEEYDRPVTNHEILYAPLNLHVRGRFHNWLEEAQANHGFTLEDVLPQGELFLVRHYLYPQPPDTHWLSQQEVAGEKHPSDFRHTIVRAMVRVRRREMFGPRALEILKPDPLFYLECRRLGLTTIDDILALSSDELRKLTATRRTFDWFVETVLPFQPDWTAPGVHFRAKIERMTVHRQGPEDEPQNIETDTPAIILGSIAGPTKNIPLYDIHTLGGETMRLRRPLQTQYVLIQHPEGQLYVERYSPDRHGSWRDIPSIGGTITEFIEQLEGFGEGEQTMARDFRRLQRTPGTAKRVFRDTDSDIRDHGGDPDFPSDTSGGRALEEHPEHTILFPAESFAFDASRREIHRMRIDDQEAL